MWGTYVTTPEIKTDFAKVVLKAKVETTQGAAESLRLQTEIRDAAGQVLATTTTALAATDGQELTQNLVVPAPKLWSPESPTLYTAVSRLYAGEVLKDEYRTPFGIRSFIHLIVTEDAPCGAPT